MLGPQGSLDGASLVEIADHGEAPDAVVRTLGWVAAITTIEFVLVFIHAFVGSLLHVVILGWLLSAYVRAPAKPASRAALGLATVPILRLLSFGMAVPELPPASWLGLVGLPLAISAAVVVRAVGTSALTPVSPSGTAVPRPATWGPQLLFGGAGIPLGLLASTTIDPQISVTSPLEFAAVVLSVVVFVAALEEVVFRGLIQRLLVPVLGIAAIPITATLYASTYVGTLSAGYLGVMALFALVAGWHVHRFGSLRGPIAAHAALSVGALIVWPMLLR